MKFATKAIHSGIKPCEATGAVMTPIYQTSTFVQSEVGVHKGFQYSRSANPTRSALEANLASLENAKYGACFSSGMAAIDCLIKMFAPGDEIIATNDLYGGSYRLFETVFKNYGIQFKYVDMLDAEQVAKEITNKTKLIWIETPTNPMLNIIDIQKVSSIAKESNVIVAVDNTFASPYLQRPLDLGADIVMHSATKYLGGHSDVVLGALATNDEDLANEMYRIQKTSGAICGPQDAYLVLRGIKTLHIRMERHCENAEKIANYLSSHSKVDQVNWPGLKHHPNHSIARAQMDGFGGMMSFSLKGNRLEDALEVLKKLRIFALAESLGGVESLVGHPATMTHAAIPKEEREKFGITDSLIRLSIGIEDADDLIEDLKQAID